MLVLIHGALGAASQMEPLRQALGDQRQTCVLELEGHGQTPTSAPFTIDRFAANVRDALTVAGVQRADLFGYSMGGYVALFLAAHAPELVASVTTLGTKLAWTPEVAARECARLNPVTIRAKVPAFAEQLERRHAGAGGWETVLARTATLMTTLGEQPTVDAALLQSIRVRTRVMVGDRDAVVTIDETASASRTIPHGELCVLPNTAHPVEQVRLSLLAALCLPVVIPTERSERRDLP